MNTIDQFGDYETFIAIVNGTITEFKDDTITSLGTGVFYNCDRLTSIDLPNVVSLGSRALYATGLANVSFPSVTDISNANACFYGCKQLTSVSIPNVTGSIPSNFFSLCSNLKTIDLSNVTLIRSSAITQCDALESVNFPLVTAIESNAFNLCAGLKDISFPKVATIARYAFQSCTSLKRVVLPSLTDLSEGAFRNCTSLTFVSLPSVQSLRRYDSSTIHVGYPFEDCAALTDIYVPFAETSTSAAGAPWGAENATVHYNTSFDQNGNPIT